MLVFSGDSFCQHGLWAGVFTCFYLKLSQNYCLLKLGNETYTQRELGQICIPKLECGWANLQEKVRIKNYFCFSNQGIADVVAFCKDSIKSGGGFLSLWPVPQVSVCPPHWLHSGPNSGHHTCPQGTAGLLSCSPSHFSCRVLCPFQKAGGNTSSFKVPFLLRKSVSLDKSFLLEFKVFCQRRNNAFQQTEVLPSDLHSAQSLSGVDSVGCSHAFHLNP